MDTDGNLLWRKIFNFGDSHNYIGDFEIIDENNFLMTYYSSDTLACTVILTDSIGDPIWTNYYLTPEYSTYQGAHALDIFIENENNIYLTGSRADSVFLFKINNNGDLQWSQIYQNFNNYKFSGERLEVLSNRKIVIGVIFRTGLYDSFKMAGLYLLDSTVTLENVIIYTDSSAKHRIFDMDVSNSDQIFLAGTGSNQPNAEDGFLISLDPNGNLAWVQHYGGNHFDDIKDININGYNHIVACGNIDSWGYESFDNIWAFKTDYSGNLLWNYVKESENIQRLISIIPINDSDYLIVGYSLSNSIYDNSKIIAERLHEVQMSNFEEPSIVDQFKINSIYPNPFNPSTNISFTNPTNSNVKINIYDLKGKHIKTLLNENLQEGNHLFRWNVENLASGVYFIYIESDEFIDSKKIVLLK